MRQATGPQAQAAHDDKLTLPGDQIKALFDQYGGKQDTIGPDSALARRLLLRADEGAEVVPLASAPLRCNPFVSAFVLGQPGCDPLLVPFVHRTSPPPPAGIEPDERSLAAVIVPPAAGHCCGCSAATGSASAS
jgi:hypothetical protein